MAEIENLKIYGGATYTVGNQDIIANEWESGKTYVKNKSYVIREHRLYVCNVTHTSVEPFDATKWTEITIGDAIANNTTAIGDLSQLTTTDKSSLVGAVNSLIPTAYSTTGLSYTNCSYVAGGYCKIGSLVIVNMRITVTGAIANSADFITGFPKPIDENANMVQVSNNANNGFTLKKDGSLSNGSTGLSSGNAVLFSVAYLTRDT